MISRFLPRKSGAFTLIELLVVISIICILAAITMPSFRAAQESARTMKCASNLRQIGAAMFLFSQDHSSCFPESGGSIAWTGIDQTSGQGPWMNQLGQYIGNPTDPQFLPQGTSIFTCPSSSYAKVATKNYSYFSGTHAAYVQAGNRYAAVRRQLITMPAEQILAGDITDWPDAVGLLDADKNDNVQNPIDIKATFHNGSINILYADGHVAPAKWLTTGSSQGYFDPSRMSTHYQGTGYLYQTP